LKILIVKLSSLGDVVHAMPAVRDIARALPNAKIDWVVERGFVPLVRRCKGVRRVIASDLRTWRKAPFSALTRQAWNRFKQDLQTDTYDAVIDLQGLSKSALVAWLANLSDGGKRYGLANQTEGSGFEVPTRWVAHEVFALPSHIHAVARSRELCARALRYTVPIDLTYGLLAQVDKAHAAIKDAALKAGLLGLVALVHGTSRADKQWPIDHWRQLITRLNDAGYGVALPHGGAAEEEAAHAIVQGMRYARVWPRLPLDALTDALATCTGVIGVDSGLSHIAVALDLPHVQIYNFDTAWRTGPETSQSLVASATAARQVSVFEQPTPSVESVWQAWQAVLATSNGLRPASRLRPSGFASL
jgi:heptosyltransferase-1